MARMRIVWLRHLTRFHCMAAGEFNNRTMIDVGPECVREILSWTWLGERPSMGHATVGPPPAGERQLEAEASDDRRSRIVTR